MSGSRGAEGRGSQPLWVAALGPRGLRPGGRPSVGPQPGAAGLGDGGGPALCPGSACGVVRDRGVGLAERSGATTLGKSRLGCGLGVESRAGELACPTAGRRPESRGRALVRARLVCWGPCSLRGGLYAAPTPATVRSRPLRGAPGIAAGAWAEPALPLVPGLCRPALRGQVGGLARRSPLSSVTTCARCRAHGGDRQVEATSSRGA